jgi:hypothetical protein
MKIRILFMIAFGILIFSDSYSNINNISKAEISYYQNNKWDFIENEFVNKVDSNINNKEIFPITFLEIMSGLFWISTEKIMKKEKALVYLSRLLFSFTSLVLAIVLIDNNSIINNLKKEKLLIILDDFFKNYSIEQKSNLQINNRKFIPQELLSTFDAIYDSHKKEGADSLKSYVNIFEMIRKKFIVPVKVK